MLTAILLAATLSPFDQVVAAERAFAALALSKGQHEAFLDTLTDDAIAFNPTPESARESHKNQPHATSTLYWGPAWVAVSAAGDLAVSIGPWKVVPSAEQKNAPVNILTGYFISMWRRQANGTWKVAVDGGTSFPMGYDLPKTVENGSARPGQAPKGDAASAMAGITDAEKAFRAKAKNGVGGAVAAQAEASVRMYREGRAASMGASAQTLFVKDKRTGTCALDRVVPASSGDFGYAYGSCDYGTGEIRKRGYLHVWRKQADGSWKILVDVAP
jgi:ketosteroid isomerase-like protein